MIRKIGLVLISRKKSQNSIFEQNQKNPDTCGHFFKYGKAGLAECCQRTVYFFPFHDHLPRECLIHSCHRFDQPTIKKIFQFFWPFAAFGFTISFKSILEDYAKNREKVGTRSIQTCFLKIKSLLWWEWLELNFAEVEEQFITILLFRKVVPEVRYQWALLKREDQAEVFHQHSVPSKSWGFLCTTLLRASWSNRASTRLHKMLSSFFLVNFQATKGCQVFSHAKKIFFGKQLHMYNL